MSTSPTPPRTVRHVNEQGHVSIETEGHRIPVTSPPAELSEVQRRDPVIAAQLRQSQERAREAHRLRRASQRASTPEEAERLLCEALGHMREANLIRRSAEQLAQHVTR